MAITSPRASARGYPAAPLEYTDEREHRRLIAEVVNNNQNGKINATGTVTLTASQATTTLSDNRIGPNSVILFMPTTANAAAEVGAGGFYVSARGEKTATLTHANNAQSDRTYAYAILG